MVQAHIFIEGLVQGVGFRYFTKMNARDLGLQGWVKNLPDGRVEALLQGRESDVKEMLSRCRSGPRSARVRNLDVEWEDVEEQLSSFEVAYY